MANTTIQLKRSSVAGKRPTTSTLNIGELALNITDQKLYSSDGSTIFEPAANVTNLNVTSNATLNVIVANGHLGTAGKVLTSNASGGIYWATSSGGGGGADTAIRQSYTADGYTDTFTVYGGYAANNADVYLNGVKLQTNVEANVQNGSTFTILTGPPPAGSSIEIIGSMPITVTTVVAKTGDTMSGALNVGNSTVGLEYISVGANVNINTSTMSVGNSTVNTQIIAGNVILNGSSITISNSTANIVITDGTLTVSNSTSNVTVGTGSISVGNSTANTTVGVSGLSEGGAPSYINSTSYSGTSNSASYIGTLPAANVVSNAQLSSNLTNYVTITNLSSNLANYQTTAGLASNVATLAAGSANSASYIGTLPAANVVSNAQLSSNLANYQTTAGMSSYQTTVGLASNVAVLAANSATYLNGNTASDFRLYTDNKTDGAYTNSISFANTKAGNAYANAVSYIEAAILTANSAITGNASAAYSNSISYINSAISTANSAITGNAATAYSNAVTYAGNKADAAYSNSISYINSAISTANSAITGNAATAYSNAVSYIDSVILTANSSITGNAATAYTNATSYSSNATNISSGTLNTARLPATANITTAINVGTNVNINTTSINVGSIAIKSNSIVISANSSIDFDVTTYKPSFQKGRMYWDNEEQTIIVFGDGSSFEQSMGQREWVRTRNSTAYTIPKGTPVYITGVDIPGDPVYGHHPTIAPGDASDYDKSQIIGITGEDIIAGAHGYTVVRGYIEGIDTSALTSGQRAHLGFLTPGTIVQSAPEYPNYPTDLGFCLTADATNGTFYVDLAMHTAERFRTTQDMYVGGDLTVSGNLHVTGNVFSTSATNLSVSDNLIYLGAGDNISTAATTHTGAGLNDMFFHGVFEGLSSIHYYVKIDSVGATDTFAWSKDNFSTTIASGISITGGYQALDNGISVEFKAKTGHTLNDKWDGTAAPINVDLGWVGNYNDGVYHHTGFFRDHSDGVYKFFQGYTPEPDAAVNIDTGHASFQFASIQANVVTANLIGTANNASYLGGTAAASYQLNSTLAANVATLSANNASYLGGTAASNYQTTAGLSDNVATLTANAATYLNSKTESNLNVNSALTANSSSYIGGISAANVVSNSQLSSNLSNYQTTAGLSDNVATLTANAATYLNNKTESNLNVNSALTSNSSSYIGGISAANVVSNNQLSSNLLNYAVNSSVYTTFTQNNSLSSAAFSGSYADLSNTPPRYVNMTQTGSLNGPYIGIARYYPPVNMTVSKVIASITYSQSSSSVFKLFKNGIDTGYTFTINSGTNVMTPVSVTISLTTADYLTLNLVSGVFNEFRVQLQYS